MNIHYDMKLIVTKEFPSISFKRKEAQDVKDIKMDALSERLREFAIKLDSWAECQTSMHKLCNQPGASSGAQQPPNP